MAKSILEKTRYYDEARRFAGMLSGSFELSEGVDAAHVEAKYTNGMLEVRVPAPQVATPRMIEVKAA